ncbi:peptidylprolyl isomerase [Salmonella enterica]
MMDNLRAAANHVVLKIILGLIIVSFILTGVGNYLIGGNNNYAAKVNGQEISRAQFENAVNNERNRMAQQLGEQFSQIASNENFTKAVRQRVLNELIDEVLVDQYAKELGLGISDEQVRATILSMAPFQSNGQFDNARFNALVNQMGMSADQYAQLLRKELTTKQLGDAITKTDFMSPAEADELLAMAAQQRVVRQAVIDVNALAAKQTVSDEEIASYYEQNKSSFIAPERFRVSYIKLDAAGMQENASEAEIQAYYDQHQDQFSQPQRNRYSIIQTKTEDEAKAILADLNNGADFATVAKEKSADIVSARNGGDMGWLEDATTPDELKNAGLKEKGQLSGVIKSSVGFLIVRLDDIQPAQVKPLSEVSDELAAKVKHEKALDAWFALQRKVSEAASNDNESLVTAEEAAGIKAVQTDWFERDKLPAELDFKPVGDAIFNGNLVGQNGAPGSNSDIITVEGDRAFVLRITDHKAEAIKPLAEVKSNIVETVKHNKALQQAKLEADKLIDALNAGKGDEALKAANLSFGEATTLKRGQDALSSAAFDLPVPAKDKPRFGTTSDEKGNIVILALDEIKSGTMPEAQKKAVIDNFTNNNAQVAFEALMNTLRKEAKIKYGDTTEQAQ